MAKKTSKVKKAKVKSKRSSTKNIQSRPKSQEKKVTPKIKKRATSKRKVVKRKKKIKRRKSRRISMEDIYKLLNKVQVQGGKVTFAVYFDEADVVENIVKDLNVKYHRNEMKTQVLFSLEPSDEISREEVAIEEYFDDEIQDEAEIDFSLYE